MHGHHVGPYGEGLYFYGHGYGAASAEAEGCEAATTSTATEFVDEGGEDAGAAGADGMAKGDGAAVDIDAGPVPVEFFAVGEGLGGEGFVDFDEVEIVDFEAGALEEAMDGTGRCGEDVTRGDGG